MPGAGAHARGDNLLRVRRLVVFALAAAVATAAALITGVTAASAHICPVAAEIPVGRQATVDVGITVEDATVSDVEIGVPAGLRLDRIDAKAGWTFTRTGSTVRYRGGPIQAFSCEYFSIGVSAPAKGSWGITVTQRDAAGTVVANAVPNPSSPTDRALDQFVYAGVKPPSPPSSSHHLSATTIIGIALAGLGVLMFAGLRVRALRARREEGPGRDDGHGEDEDDREAELRSRLERFKKGTPDPRPPA